MKDILEGGFTQFRELNYSDWKVFDKNFGNLFGVKYTPYAVSTQVVSKAVNYKFLCTKTLVLQEPITTIVIVSCTEAFGDAGSVDVPKVEGEVELKA